MTRRERIELRIEKRRQWAESRKADATTRFAAAHRIADGIPLGQPILVGHHSERHARADQGRIHSNMSKGCESQAMAERHVSVAGSLAHQLETSIFSDDAGAVAELQARIEQREAEASRIKALNAAIRREMKGGLTDGWLARTGATEAEKRQIAQNVQHGWKHEPMFPAYVLSNLRGRITADRERIKSIETRAKLDAEAAAAPGGVIVKRLPEFDLASVRFAEKPDRSILDALRGAGFVWQGGAWSGRLSALPEALASENPPRFPPRSTLESL